MHHLIDSATEWVINYGSFALFFLLALGIIGLPIPDETLLVFVGFLIAKDKLSPIPMFIAAFTGSALGITISYILGFATEKLVIKKYGPWVGITEAKIEKVRYWFDRIDKWVLFFGYFIPGVRHLTGYIAGTTEMGFRRFMIYAYTGAFVWATTFLTLGYFSASIPFLSKSG